MSRHACPIGVMPGGLSGMCATRRKVGAPRTAADERQRFARPEALHKERMRPTTEVRKHEDAPLWTSVYSVVKAGVEMDSVQLYVRSTYSSRIRRNSCTSPSPLSVVNSLPST